MEYVNNKQPDATTDPQESAEELSFCNCENNACETPYQPEDVAEAIRATADTTPKSHTFKRLCRTTASHWRAAWKQTDGMPRIKQTASYRLDVYQDADQKTPVDHFYAEKTNTCNLRTLLIAAAAAVLVCFLGGITSKGKKKG